MNSKPLQSERFGSIEYLYFSLYVAFARIGAGLWPKRMNDEANNGAFGVAVIAWIWIMIFCVGASHATHSQALISKPMWIVTALLTYAGTFVHLIYFRTHRTYDTHFKQLPEPLRVRHLAVAWVVIFLTAASFGISIYLSRSMVAA